MKKIPTLFTREYANHRVVNIKDEITPGCEEAFLHGQATVKIDGIFYKRYDAKNGKKPPAGAIPCCDPDPVTGHWPHWVKVDENNPADRWFIEAYNTESAKRLLPNGTYEAIGPHFQANPHNLNQDCLVPHGAIMVNVKRTFEGVREYLREHIMEGLVFWLDEEPMCKIKRSDFGFEWPVKK